MLRRLYFKHIDVFIFVNFLIVDGIVRLYPYCLCDQGLYVQASDKGVVQSDLELLGVHAGNSSGLTWVLFDKKCKINCFQI